LIRFRLVKTLRSSSLAIGIFASSAIKFSLFASNGT
jgi:hypothetical protein